ncbi:MAG TPA: hypothetical protein VFR14_07090, partial [Candidatus Limnocylindrales bacterium]|nr:hypothetical protein [Candidatus Limnocylindrales bacterium]
MPTRSLFLAIATLAVVAACGRGGATTPPSSAPGSGDATRIDVHLTDSFRIEPGDFQVPAGEPVTFVVTNAGVLDHEFFVGDEAAQTEHD